MSSPAFADFPSLTLEVDFTVGPGVAGTTWTDLTAWLIDGETNSANRVEEGDVFGAGTATFRLDNRDRRFDPLHAAGPYFGNLKPMRQIRLRATWAAVTYDLWRGYVDKWPQSYPEQGLDSEVTITCTDGFGVLTADLPDSVWAYKVGQLLASVGGYWYRLAELAGTQMADAGPNKLHGKYQGGATFNHRQGILPYGTTDGAIEFNGADMAGTVPAAAIGTSGNLSIIFWTKMPNEVPDDGVFGHRQELYRQERLKTNDIGRLRFTLEPVAGGLGGAPGSLVFEVDGIPANPRWSNARMEDNSTHLVAGTVATAGPTAQLYIDGVQQTRNDSGASGLSQNAKNEGTIGGVYLGANGTSYKGTISEFLIIPGTVLAAIDIADLYAAGANPWAGDTSGTRIGRLADIVEWPASLRNIDAGTSTLGPASLGGKALDAMQVVERTEAGLLYIAGDGKLTFVSRTNLRAGARFLTSQGTFGDGAGEVPYSQIATSGWDRESIVTAARVGRAGGQVQEYIDTTAKADYGLAWAPDETDLLMATDGEALDRAVWKVKRRNAPAFKVDSVTIRPRHPDATVVAAAWPQVLGRQLGDRVTTKRRPLNVGTAISQDGHVGAITHRFSSSLEWETTFGLVSADPNELLYAQVGAGAARNRVGTAKVGY